MIWLKQSTASQEIALGHFVDDTDGKTAETALSIANTDIKLWKAGATTLANKNSGGATHISGGIYYAVLDATDTDTLGPLHVFVHVAGALPVKVQCCVFPANVYDSLIAGSDKLDVNAAELGGTSQTGRDVGASVLLSSGTGAGQISLSSGAVTVGTNSDKTGYSLADGAITAAKIGADAFTAAKFAADVTTEFQAGLSTLDAAGVRSAVGLASANLDTQLAAIDDSVDTEVAAIFNRIGAPVGASISADIAAVKSETASIVADTNELQTDWADGGRLDLILDARASQSSLDTVDDFLDTEIAAIKAKTDNLPSDPADASDIASSFTTVNGKLDTIDDFLDTEIAAIKAKTDNLPSDPADASDIASSFSTVNSTLTTLSGYVDTEVAAIKAKTDLIPAAPAAVSDIPTATTIADATLARAIAAEAYAADGGTPTLSQILWMIWSGLVDYSISGTTLTVRKQDGTTAMTFTLDSATTPTSRTRAT